MIIMSKDMGKAMPLICVDEVSELSEDFNIVEGGKGLLDYVRSDAFNALRCDPVTGSAFQVSFASVRIRRPDGTLKRLDVMDIPEACQDNLLVVGELCSSFVGTLRRGDGHISWRHGDVSRDACYDCSHGVTSCRGISEVGPPSPVGDDDVVQAWICRHCLPGKETDLSISPVKGERYCLRLGGRFSALKVGVCSFKTFGEAWEKAYAMLCDGYSLRSIYVLGDDDVERCNPGVVDS